jgi:uncharacterized UPF0160 family protein
MEIEYYGKTEKTKEGYTVTITKRNKDGGNTMAKETEILRITHKTKIEAENTMRSVLALMRKHKEVITELKTEIEKTLNFITQTP